MNMPKIDTNWIWTPDWDIGDTKEAQWVYFRKTLRLSAAPADCRIRISADSRYKLYVNGYFIQEGPAKGGPELWYCDGADISGYLQEGDNVLAVIVLRYPSSAHLGNCSLYRTEMPCLYVEGSIKDRRGKEWDISGKSGWKCFRERKLHIVSKEISPAPLHHLEEAGCTKALFGWKESFYDDSRWTVALPYDFFMMDMAASPCNLQERPIPYQRHKPGKFKKIMKVRENDIPGLSETDVKAQWYALLSRGESVTVPPNCRLCVEVDAGELMTGYLSLRLQSGAGADIFLHCAECYGNGSLSPAGVPVKKDRTDCEHGQLFAYEDLYHCEGLGNRELPEIYEPFWFRTFRFVGVTVMTGQEPLVISGLDFTETGYPLDIRTHVTTSDESLEAIWGISQRTLKRCMHETYMDCPFFEQLQYVMDSRSQILFTYNVAADDRLARQCMEDIRRSQRSDGTVNSCAPSVISNVIPGFSIYYILMVYDHMMYFGDRALVRKHFSAIDRVLGYFACHCLENGLVGKNGGALYRDKYWSFVDWAPEWGNTTGVPSAILKGPITMDSLLYIYGLEHAAKLAVFLGFNDVAAEYERRAEKVRGAIRTYCTGKDGFVMDGPGVDEYSVHCQVFAVLTHTISKVIGKRLLSQSVNQPGFVQCSVSMDFYLFRALEMTGLYDMTDELWELWRGMIKNHLTTCVENDTDARSDCHAWGAIALYELPAASLGVRPASPGYEKIRICPVTGYQKWARGEVITPKGMVSVSWEKDDNGKIHLDYQVPEGMEVQTDLQDGNVQTS